MEVHEAQMQEIQNKRRWNASDRSSEDTGRRTSPEQSATTISTVSALPSLDLDIAENKASRPPKDNVEELSDDAPSLPQLAKAYYKHPKYSRRVQSKSEPSGGSCDAEAQTAENCSDYAKGGLVAMSPV
jgi:hypothetical protein